MVDTNNSVASPTKTAQPKVLRVLLCKGRQVIEDKILSKPENVSITSDPTKKATFIVPSPNVPKYAVVLEHLSHHSYQLLFNDRLTGKISNTQGQFDFNQLKTLPGLVTQNDGYAFPLSAECRGRIAIGDDYILLFQYVDAPIAEQVEQLHFSFKETLMHSIDWLFVGLLFGAFILEGGLVIALYHTPMPKEVTLEEIDERWAKLIVPELKVEKPKDEPKQTDTGEGPSQKQQPTEKMEKQDTSKMTETQKEAYTAARKEKAKSLVAGKGVLAMIGTAGEGSAGGFVADVFGQKAGISDGAFDGITGIGVATAGSAERTHRGGSAVGDAASIDKLGTSGGGQVSSGAKREMKVASVVKSEAPEVDGDLDPNAIVKYVKSRMASIKECYEKELKRDPKLAGKITIGFTIESDGKVSDTYVEGNTMGNKNVANCIAGRIRSWRFPKPKGGSVPVAYPFIFSPGN